MKAVYPVCCGVDVNAVFAERFILYDRVHRLECKEREKAHRHSHRNNEYLLEDIRGRINLFFPVRAE